MASTSWPQGTGTRVTTDPQYERLAAAWAAPGVVGVPTDTAVVYADGTGTRTAKIRANKFADLRGWGWHSGTSDFSLPSHASNASGSNRYDTIVLRFSRSTYTVVEAIVQGANGAAAGAAALTQSITEPLTSGTFEIPLAVVRVGPGATVINAGDVTPCAWFTSADAVVTNSDSYYQPQANLGFPRLRHADTGTTYVPYSGAWRRADWSSPWGVIAGKNWRVTSAIAGAYLFSSYTDLTVRTGNASMLLGRRYMIEYSFGLTYSATADVAYYMGVQVRKPAGTLVGLDHIYPTMPVYHGWYFKGSVEYEPAANETLDFQLWGFVAKVAGTTLNWAQLVGGLPTYLRVRDDGPTGVIAHQT